MPVKTSSKTIGRPDHDLSSTEVALEVLGRDGLIKDGLDRIVEMSWRWNRGSLWGDLLVGSKNREVSTYTKNMPPAPSTTGSMTSPPNL